ncbi:hypothetical protein [Sphaerisporangium flaviroseum]
MAIRRASLLPDTLLVRATLMDLDTIGRSPARGPVDLVIGRQEPAWRI